MISGGGPVSRTWSGPITRSLEYVGERWSMLITPDAFDGFTPFDKFERSLGITPNMPTGS